MSWPTASPTQRSGPGQLHSIIFCPLPHPSGTHGWMGEGRAHHNRTWADPLEVGCVVLGCEPAGLTCHFLTTSGNLGARGGLEVHSGGNTHAWAWEVLSGWCTWAGGAHVGGRGCGPHAGRGGRGVLAVRLLALSSWRLRAPSPPPGGAGEERVAGPCPGILMPPNPLLPVQVDLSDHPPQQCPPGTEPRPWGRRGFRAEFLSDLGPAWHSPPSCPPKTTFGASSCSIFWGSWSVALTALLGSSSLACSAQFCEDPGRVTAPVVAEGPRPSLPRNVLSERERRWAARNGEDGVTRLGTGRVWQRTSALWP